MSRKVMAGIAGLAVLGVGLVVLYFAAPLMADVFGSATGVACFVLMAPVLYLVMKVENSINPPPENPLPPYER